MFGWRGGTAPPHKQRATGGFNPTACSSNNRQQSSRCDRQGSLALPTAPVFRGRTSATRRSSDGMGPMVSSRPASRQALSDLMDLNLALKFDKMGKHGEKRPPKKRSQSQFNTRGDKRDNVGARAGSPSASKRLSAPPDRQERQASARCSTSFQRFNAEARIPNTSSAAHERTTGHDHLDEAVPVSHKEPIVDQYEWDDGLHSATSYVAATDIPLMISPSEYLETHLGKASQGKASQYTAAPLGAKCSAWKSQGYGGQEPSDKVEETQSNISSCQETSSQQSEKDQRMWSALKTSLLSGSEGDTDSTFLGLDKCDKRVISSGISDDNADTDFAIGGEEISYAFLKGTRDMEQLDLERSAMDRTMRPHRVASARLLETAEASPVQTKVKQPRVFSASATRSRTRHKQPTSSVWLGAGGTLQCTGVRAELLSRGGDGSGFCSEPLDSEDREGYGSNTGEAGNNRREASHQLTRRAEPGRFQWVTNDEGVANFLQRPPSRQKEAFPTHLADVIPHAAFQVETPMADEEAKQHIEATRKKAVEHTRPPSRHKPPGQSLFLEVPETRRQVSSAFCPPRAPGANGTDSCGVLPSGVIPMEVPDVEASPTSRDALGEIFALDRRHDNPDRDGFSVLQVQGPCPFRIEVTNSETGTSSSSKWSSNKLVQPQPPAIPVDREAAVMPNARKAAKYCLPDPPCGLFAPMTHGVGGRASPGIQRAPINTTPGSGVSSPVPTGGNAGGKAFAMPCGLLGSRSTGGIALRSSYTPAPGHAQGEDGTAEGGSPAHRPRTGNGSIEVEGRSATFVGGEKSGIRKGSVQEGGGRRGNTAEGGNHPSGRGDTSGLLVNTGTSVLHVSDWSLQSCDDVDDGAFLDGPASTLGDSGGTKHSLLETTLGQDFLSLFAPSPRRGNASGFSEI